MYLTLHQMLRSPIDPSPPTADIQLW